jgi:hypothetical protein
MDIEQVTQAMEVPQVATVSQSQGLSERHINMSNEGRHLTDDSVISEKNMTDAMVNVVAYAKSQIESMGGKIVYKKTITLFECQQYFHKAGGPPPNPENQKVYMKPDGGIIFAQFADNVIPVLMVEDKVQGTNDILFEQGKKRQSTGNAIERGAKNIRGAEMLFSGKPIFPYVLFASGCDFHHTETIAKRIEMMNMGVPNHYMEVTQSTTPESIDNNIDAILQRISIDKVCNTGIACVFVKAHQWNVMKHRSSLWQRHEYEKICKHIIDLVLRRIM